ncbi:7226_t:CDS:2, partial [Acaulospora colombiana]
EETAWARCQYGVNAPQCTILQAACATVAAPDAYEPVSIGEGDDVMTYIGAMNGYANPTNEMLKEAEKILGKDRLVATIISVGSGKLDLIHQQGSVNDILKRALLDTERRSDKSTNCCIFRRGNYQPEDGWSGQLTSNSILDSISKVEIKYRQRPGVVTFFVGRQDIIDRLYETHIRNAVPEGDYPTISVLTGLGGSGKTQIALRFAKQFEAISKDQLKEDYQAIIRSRGIAHRTSTWEHALQWLAYTGEPWLIIVDNADDPNLDLHPFMPKCPRNHIIITTRNVNKGLMARTHTYHVQELAADDSVKLLLGVSGYDLNEVNDGYAKAIVSALGHLPLAIAQAAGYIYKHKCLSSYLKLFEESKEKLLAQKVMELPHGYNLSVATTLEMSFDRLPLRSRQALCILSYLHNTSIPHKIIEIASQNKFFYASGKASDADTEKLAETKAESEALCKIFCPAEKWSEVEFYEIIEPCLQYSLLLPTTSVDDQKFYSMHILVQSWLQMQSTPNAQHSSRLLAKRMLLAVVQEGEHYQYLKLHQILLPHLRTFAGQSLGVATDDALMYQVLSDCRDDSTALVHIASYMDLVNSTLEPDAPERLKALRDLTYARVMTGRLHEAVIAGEEAVRLCMESLGRDAPWTLQSKLNLASAYRSVGQYEDARKIDEEVLEDSKKLLGTEHPDTLTAMGSLSEDYTYLGEYKKALQLDEETLELHKRLLGPEHPDTLGSMHKLAVDYGDLTEYKKSQELNEETLALMKKVLGTEHPSTLTSMDNLALAYSNLKEHEKARELNEETLALHMKVLGPEHPSTLICMSNLAFCYNSLEEYRKAQELNEETLALHVK